MDKEFFCHWFRGFAEGMRGLTETERNKMFAACGRACSESYSLDVFRRLRARTVDCAGFFEQLQNEIPAIEVEALESGRVYEIRYRECLCDLRHEGLMDDPMLCECSRRSLLYNLSAVFPHERITVDLRGSILRGDEKCVLRVEIWSPV